MKCSHCEEERTSRCSYADCPFEIEQAGVLIERLQARIKQLEEALRECQGALALVIAPGKSGSYAAISTAWAACVAAETKARSLLNGGSNEHD